MVTAKPDFAHVDYSINPKNYPYLLSLFVTLGQTFKLVIFSLKLPMYY